ncbi:hypothetical protein BDR03DRAFT_280756 [Suillus americanus]|nr:hypothetical protein BDR03DRAFT_280756 [Suillus americanus]
MDSMLSKRSTNFNRRSSCKFLAHLISSISNIIELVLSFLLLALEPCSHVPGVSVYHKFDSLYLKNTRTSSTKVLASPSQTFMIDEGT